MTKEVFTATMEKFKVRYDEVEAKLSQIYEALGIDIVEVLDYISFNALLVETIAAAIDPEKAPNIAEDIYYLMSDCNFDLGTFEESVTIMKDGEEKHPILSTWEDFYDYLIDT
jgi:hypothetical protein